MSGPTWDEIERLMGEDPDDRAIREAHGFTYEDDFEDRSLLCRNGCGASYYDIAVGKMRKCRSAEARLRSGDAPDVRVRRGRGCHPP